MITSKDGFEAKILELCLKNESKKKNSICYIDVDLARYVKHDASDQFETHFLKLDLLDDQKHKAGQLTATLKVRRDPTGKVNNDSDGSNTSSRDSSTPTVGKGATSSSAAVATDDAGAAAAAAAAAADEMMTRDNDGGDDKVVGEGRSMTGSDDMPRQRRQKLSARAGEISSKASSEVGDEPDDAPTSLTDGDDKLRRNTSRRQMASSMTSAGGGVGGSGGDDDLNVSGAGSRRRGERKAQTQPSSPRDGAPLTPPAPRRGGTEIDVSDSATNSRTSPGVLRHRASLDTPVRSGGGESLDASTHELPARPGMLTRMESLRADNLRKYGHRQSQRSGNDVVSGSSPPSQAAPAPATATATAGDATSALLREREAELDQLKSQLQAKQRDEDRRFFVEEAIVFMEPAYGTDGLPISAYVILRALTHWDAFAPANARFLHSLLDGFDKVLKRNMQNRELLLYWLGTLSALLHLIRADAAAGGLASSASAHILITTASDLHTDVDPETSRSTSSTATPPGTRRGDSPLASFVAALTSVTEAFFERAVTMLLAQIDPLLVPAVLEGDMSRPERNAAPNARLLDVLGGWHRAVSETHRLPAPIIAQLFVAVFDEMGVRLLNALFDRRDLCTCGSALQAKMHASALVQWAHQRKLTVAAQMAPVLQAADVLVMNKSALLEESTRANVCPELNASQLHRLLSLYTQDEYDADAVHPGVLLQMGNIAARDPKPLQRHSAPLRLDARLGSITYDVGGAATRLPPSLTLRAGFEFLAQAPRSSTRATPAKLATALAGDEPW